MMARTVVVVMTMVMMMLLVQRFIQHAMLIHIAFPFSDRIPIPVVPITITLALAVYRAEAGRREIGRRGDRVGSRVRIVGGRERDFARRSNGPVGAADMILIIALQRFDLGTGRGGEGA